METKKKDLLGNFIIFCCLVWLPGWFLMGRLKVIQWGSCKMTRLETQRQVPAFAVVNFHGSFTSRFGNIGVKDGRLMSSSSSSRAALAAKLPLERDATSE
jgi:hypothetical protein